MSNHSSQIKKGDKKVINAWIMYDWANSVYPLVITTAIFPLYYINVVEDNVLVLGKMFDSVEIYSYALALSLIVVSILSPILSGVADYSGSKKTFMKWFNYLGALSCVGLTFFESYPIEFGLFLCMTSNIGFWGSLVFYNAYLPEIAEPKDHDMISARGFSRGYLGSFVLLVICLVLIKAAGVPAKYCFALVGVWWIGFAQLTYRRLPGNVFNKQLDAEAKSHMFSKGFQELKGVWKEFSHIKRLKRFLTSFFVYSMAVQTIMTMAQFFGTEAVEWPSDDSRDTGMIVSILLIQLIAIPGSMLFATLSRKWGNINVLGIALLVWISICLGSYYVNRPIGFYVLAGVVGFVMGGIQSLSRSTYSKFLPETEDHASYFSFYDVLEKVGMSIGIISFGFLNGVYNIRYSVMALTIFFVIGILLLLLVPKEKKDSTILDSPLKEN